MSDFALSVTCGDSSPKGGAKTWEHMIKEKPNVSEKYGPSGAGHEA